MISLGNQLVLQFNIGDMTDFLDIEDFHYMRIAENAGGLRPIINLSFQVTDESIVPFLNSGNLISLMYGITQPSSDILQFEILGDDKTKDYHVGSTVHLLGAMYNRGFTSQVKSYTFQKKKSYEALQMLAARNGLKFVTNVTKTNDMQDWYQSGQTDWQMLNQIAPYAYKDMNTFYTYGFDNNNLYFYDVRQQVLNGPKWILSVNALGDSEQSALVNIGTYKCDDTNAGTNALFAGKNITNVSYNMDTGEFANPKYNLKTFTTLDTDSVNVNAKDCINYNYQVTTSDTHRYSIEAQNQNFRNNVLFSSYTCHVPVAGQYRDFRLLDCVQLIPAEDDPEAKGIYFITGIAKEYKDNLYTTLLTLNRESPNGIKGENLEGGA